MAVPKLFPYLIAFLPPFSSNPTPSLPPSFSPQISPLGAAKPKPKGKAQLRFISEIYGIFEKIREKEFLSFEKGFLCQATTKAQKGRK